MKIIFHLGHPAHYHLFKNPILKLQENGHQVNILIKKKDVLEELLMESGLKYRNILPAGRKNTKAGIAWGQLKQDFNLFQFAINNRPDIMIGTSVAISHVGKILRIPSINVNEDDAEVVPFYARLAYPWASIILAPKCCSVSKWEKKRVAYNSYHELAYLHPNNFSPQLRIAQKYISLEKPYFILRFAKLGAHHDAGIKGISDEIAAKLVELLDPFGRVYITSERKLDTVLEPYRIQINPIDIHHVMAFAKIYIGDSQTMAAESGVLGVPFIRFNDFVGRISYLDELENKYQLGFGIKTNEIEKLTTTIKRLVNVDNLNELHKERRLKMLSEKIDYTAFLIWFIENYPDSKRIMSENPDYQYRFKQ